MSKRKPKSKTKTNKLNNFEADLCRQVLRDFKLSGTARLDKSVGDAIIYAMRSGKPEFNALATKYHKYMCGYCKGVCEHSIQDCKLRNKETENAAINCKIALEEAI